MFKVESRLSRVKISTCFDEQLSSIFYLIHQIKLCNTKVLTSHICVSVNCNPEFQISINMQAAHHIKPERWQEPTFEVLYHINIR